MNNRNKRFTSVLAASMALGTFAPAFANVAPVFAADADTNTGETTTTPAPVANADLIDAIDGGVFTATAEDADGSTYAIYESSDEATVGTPGSYVAVLTKGVNSANVDELTVDSTVKATAADGTVYNATLLGIDNNAFAGNQNLTSVTINGGADDLMIVGDNAFQGCSKVTTVALTNVKSIGQNSFATADGNVGTGSLYDVTFDAKLETIGQSAFSGQDGIETVTLPEGLKKIEATAFANTGLSGVIALPTTLESIGANAFFVDVDASDGLVLAWPTKNGSDVTTIKVGSGIFGTLNSKSYYVSAIGAIPTDAAGIGTAYWQSAPSITATVNKVASTNKNVKTVLGNNVVFSANQIGKLYINDTMVARFNNTADTYTLTTPQVGTYNVKFEARNGATRTMTLTIVTYDDNMWLNANITVPQWTLGADVTPTGAVAKYGDVYYMYSSSKNGTYRVEKPNYTGTWWVKAYVNATDQYTGLETGPVSFKVLPAGAVDGWVANGSNWNYFKDGEMVKGQLLDVNGTYFYIDDNGNMATGWKKDALTNDNWMYFVTSNGAAKTNWLNLNGTWYYFNDKAVMQEGTWVNDPKDGNDYYLTTSGAMAASRWVKKDGNWVYVDNSGAMKHGWLYDPNEMAWYYLDPTTGYMATNTTVDGWTIQANGQAIQG